MNLLASDPAKELNGLAFELMEKVRLGLSEGTLVPGEETYLKWKVNDFEYGENGVTKASSTGDYLVKKSWLMATLKLQEEAKLTGEYKRVLEKLATVSKRLGNIPQDLDRFTGKLIALLLNDPPAYEERIYALISAFLKDLSGEPVSYGATVELDGVVILCNAVQFKVGDTDIILRQTTKEDLEKESSLWSGRTFLPNPSAILDIKILGRQVNEVQLRIEQAITILRLFSVGSVISLGYQMRSDSITDMMGGVSGRSGTRDTALNKYIIRNQQKEPLRQFWNEFTKAMPASFYDFSDTRIDHLDTAYKRYCDALLQNGIMERRVANAVMGLESLFLKGGELQELSYRLGIRMAKVASLLGYDPHRTKDILGDAYEIRSQFVHGSYLPHKDKRKLERKYVTVSYFLEAILDYLRVSIVVWTMVKKDKEEFLDLIDDSLIDDKKRQALDSLLAVSRPFVVPQTKKI